MNYLIEIEDEIKRLGFEIISKDFDRPWGGFLVISEELGTIGLRIDCFFVYDNRICWRVNSKR